MPRPLNNEEIAIRLHELSFFLELEGDEGRARAYERAARSVEASPFPIVELYSKEGVAGLMRLPGVGRGIAERLRELLEQGRLRILDELRAKHPIRLEELLSVEGLGPKGVKRLYQQLGIKGLEELEVAAKEGRLRLLPGFGPRSEERILKSIAFLKGEGGRTPLGIALPLAQEIMEQLRGLGEKIGLERLALAGSARRCRESVGDIDLLALSKEPSRLIDAFTHLPQVEEVLERGSVKASARLRNGLKVDLRVIEEEGSWGAALLYFTGSKEHNIALRRLALEKGLHLNEYGLFKGDERVAGRDEGEVYGALGMPWIAPELREDRGEVAAALEDRLPDLVELGQLKGDLQTQTNWTDGANGIEEMALAAQELGLQYIAITDHTKALAMTGGLDEERLREQGREIDRINEKLSAQGLNFTILKGAEVNILKDGRLDISDAALKELDIVGAAVHTNFKMGEREMTERIIRAMENPHVDILFHPTGRLLRQRAPYAVDMERIIDVAKATGTILEIDAYPDRLDLKDEYIRMAVERGVKLCIDSDAHSRDQLGYLWYGVAQARRGWAGEEQIINTRPLKELLRSIKG